MRILAFSANPVTWTRKSAIGGAEIRYASILHGWYKKNIEIIAVESKSSTSKRLGVKYPVYTIRIPERVPLIVKFIAWVAGCIRYILSNKKTFDLIYAPTNNVSDLVSSLLAKVITKKPLVICVQNANPVYSFKHVFNLYGGSFLNRLLLTFGNILSLIMERYADLIIAISKATKDTLVSLGLNEAKIVINGMGVEDKLVKEFERPQKKEYDAVFIGRIEKEKGIFDLLKAWVSIVKRRPMAKLLIIGDGSELENVKRYIKESKISDNVILTGPIYGEEKYDLLKRSKIMVYPTFSREGFCLSILDALSCGLPVIAYNEYFTVDVYRQCKAVIFIHRDVLDLQRVLLKLLELNESELQEYSIHAYNFVKNRTWTKIAMDELRLIKNKLLRV
ncbi:MAG: glycosyltransferase family 4 protein [Candidatus Bathyarchaeia archaeon]